MNTPYEFVVFDYDGFAGKTFGCSCCSYSDELPMKNVADEFFKTAEMYQRLHDQYMERGNIIRRYSAPVVIAYMKMISQARQLEDHINEYFYEEERMMAGRDYTEMDEDIKLSIRQYIKLITSWTQAHENISNAWKDIWA